VPHLEQLDLRATRLVLQPKVLPVFRMKQEVVVRVEQKHLFQLECQQRRLHRWDRALCLHRLLPAVRRY
jgi:hypothetical protein